MRPVVRVCVVVLAIAAWFASLGVLLGVEPQFTVRTDGQQIFVTPVQGSKAKIRVTAVGKNSASGVMAVVVNGEPELIDWRVTLTFDALPPVPPNPDPPKPDPPKPVPRDIWGIVVEETAQRTPEQAAVILNPRVEAAFKSGGGKFMVVDGWNQGARRDVGAFNPYVDRSDALKIRPFFVIVGPDGVVYYEGPLPKTVQDLEILVSKIRKGEKP